MTARIQQAYYLEARNPSDNDTLVDLAADIGLDTKNLRRRLGRRDYAAAVAGGDSSKPRPRDR